MIVDEDSEFLQHYGVKGQKWGKRTKRSSSKSSKYTGRRVAGTVAVSAALGVGAMQLASKAFLGRNLKISDFHSKPETRTTIDHGVRVVNNIVKNKGDTKVSPELQARIQKALRNAKNPNITPDELNKLRLYAV